jgi:hypothetical protein
MKEKWNVRKKGYLKIHIAVDVKSKEILFMMKVTHEHVHDSKALPELVENIIKSNNMTVGKLFVDGTYEGNEVLDICWTKWNLTLH